MTTVTSVFESENIKEEEEVEEEVTVYHTSASV